MSASLEKLSADFTALIGPEAFAKHAAAVAAAQAAAAAHAAAVAQASAAAKAAAAAAPKPATPAMPVSPVAVPSAQRDSQPRVSVSPPTAKPSDNLTASTTPPAKPPTPAAPVAAAPRPATAPAAAAAPRPATPAAPPPPPPAPLQKTDHAAVGCNLDATVAPDQVVAAARLLDARGFALDAITGVDWLAQNQMEVVYDYFHPTEAQRVVVRTRVPRTAPEVPTIVEVFPGANWHERETHDFFGLTFRGHPNMKPFLLPEDANFHPLRKDYAP